MWDHIWLIIGNNLANAVDSLERISSRDYTAPLTTLDKKDIGNKRLWNGLEDGRDNQKKACAP